MGNKYLLLAALLAAVTPAWAQEAQPAAPAVEPEEPQETAEQKADREAMENEIAFVEALVSYGYPDIAEPVIAETKKKWPQSEAGFFAIEVRGMLSMNKFDEAEKLIASLPDRKGSKYWAARLEVANNYFGRNQKEECMKIYDEFFQTFPKPPKGLEKFYVDAGYAYGQILSQAKNYDKASDVYGKLLPNLTGKNWLSLATEYCDMLMRVAENCTDKEKAKRDQALNTVGNTVDKLIAQSGDNAVLFGRAIGMKAHLEQLKGNIKRANLIIEEFKPELMDIDDQIRESDPEGRLGLLKISPLPEVMYLQAKMLWEEAKKEYANPKRNDDQVKNYMFGERDESGKRDGIGAFNLSLAVYTNFEMSPWAPLAGELAEEVRQFAEEKYEAKIKTKITAEQIARVRAAQFKTAKDKFLAQEFLPAIADYMDVLAKYPELEESVYAVQNVIYSYLDAINDEPNADLKAEYRDNADAIEGYLAERFAGSADNVIMTTAGNAVLACAGKELERGEAERADRLFTWFVVNYRNHVKAPSIAAGKGGEMSKAGRLEDSIRYWRYVEEYYANSQFYSAALLQLAQCYDKLGNRDEAKKYYKAYLPSEKSPANQSVANMQLAQMYQKDGQDMLNGSEEAETEEAKNEAVKKGMVQIIYAIKQFNDLATQAEAGLGDQRLTEAERKTLAELREGSLFLAGQCRGRLGQILKKIGRIELSDKQMAASAEAYDAYLAAYPQGKYAKSAYVQQGTIYTALGQLDKSKEALDRLSRAFPDSEEAKNAKPHLAKSLIEMGMKREGTEIYSEMLRTSGSYTPQQFVSAGEALIEAKSWDLANQAFEKAIQLAGTNYPQTVAKARLGEARSAYKQNSLAEAREALDIFLQDPKMSKMAIAADANFLLVEVAKEQGRHEKDETMRGKYFGAAVGALKKVRTYWAKKPQWEQDQLDLLSGDVLVDRMKAELSMDLKEEAAETRGRAAATFQVFIQAHGVTEEHPFDKMEQGEKDNLERAYGTLLPLLADQIADKQDPEEKRTQAGQVIKFAEQYMQLFPTGKYAAPIGNAMNSAKADLN